MPRVFYKVSTFALVVVFITGACGPGPAPTGAPRTPVPTWTLPFSLTASPRPGATLHPSESPPPASATALVVPTLSLLETATPIPAASPTARPGIDPTLGASAPDPNIALAIPVPPPMPQLHMDKDIVNILLLGRDTDRTSGSYRTDVMIVVSINKAENAVTMLTIPRDLFVYIPGWTMNRINTAAGWGDATGYPGGGVALLEQTILYNLGLPIHGWARVDFQGFKDVVDVVGGVDVPVSCAMQDWRLKDPSYSLQDDNADHWHLYTVESGVQHMDGDLALWYARSRKRSSDFDRSRRQHQVLRAIFEKALRLQMLTKVPELYSQYVEIVDTDLGLGDLLQFVPMAAQLDRARIKSRFIGREHVFAWTTPQGAAVLLPNRDTISALLAEAFVPPSQNVLAREAPSVEIWNSTSNSDWPALAADNLAWAGITPVLGVNDSPSRAATVIYDFTTSAKGSALREVQRLFGVANENVIAQPDPRAAYPFRVVLGSDFSTCVKPQPILRTTPTPWAPGSGPVSEDIIHAAAVLEPPPGLDGDLAEWTFLVYSLQEINLGAADWEGPPDLSAHWNIAWDDEYLYIALDVQDTTFIQGASGENLFQGDSLEVWFDADLRGDGAHTELNADDYQLGLSPGNLTSPHGGPEAFLWQPVLDKKPIPGAIVVGRLLDSRYALEVAIPWSTFKVTPAAGQSYGFALALNDDDTPGSAEQQSQVTNGMGQMLADPTTWGILVLDSPPPP